jgi:DNA-directed RNA polymerase subunit omega
MRLFPGWYPWLVKSRIREKEELSMEIKTEGITNPPIDQLLEKSGSKYSLVLYAAKRARQINAYYSQLGEGLLEYVGPLVETNVHEKPLSIALREISEDLLSIEQLDPITNK